jgi:hypothetical protein
MDLRLGWENRWSGEIAKLHGVWMCGQSLARMTDGREIIVWVGELV